MLCNRVIIFIFASFVCSVYGDVQRPRGVSIANAGFYLNGKDFTCLDGSSTISFSWVNDDYCDCEDGSDEPGTSACPNGHFHCPNKGYKPKDILSSRVNDGICDCCDGSDEFLGLTPCNNYCKELGLVMQQEMEIKRQKLIDGHAIYKEYAQKGTDEKRAQQQRLDELENLRAELEPQRKQLEVIKQEAEKPEKEAKERQKQLFEEAQKAVKEENEKNQVGNAFTDLDKNNDGFISVDEVQLHEEFDIDSNGEVSHEEAKEYLEDNDQVDVALFDSKIWPNIKDIYKASPREEVGGGYEHHEEQHHEEEHHEDEHHEDEHHEERDQDVEPPLGDREEIDEERDDDDDYRDANKSSVKSGGGSLEDSYDEETRALIAAADKARADFEEIDHRWKDIERDINNARKIVQLDLGPNNEFYPLKDQCYEYSEREYTYKLCPFDSASQRSKSGGSETRLGSWGNWAGREDQRYSVMNMDRGQGCWNGPERSVKVHIHCGQTNELTSASEPSRCEYEMHFSTPAACSEVPPPAEPNYHEEL